MYADNLVVCVFGGDQRSEFFEEAKENSNSSARQQDKSAVRW